MKFRNLRIAWSVGCGIACVLLIVLWVRSYRVRDDLQRADGTTLINIESYRGELGIGQWAFPKPIPWRWSGEDIDGSFADRLWSPMKDQIPLSYLGIRWQTMSPLHLFAIHYWFPVTLTAVLAILPWLVCPPRRFSLRTLLIATTLVAVVLGLVIYAVKKVTFVKYTMPAVI